MDFPLHDLSNLRRDVVDRILRLCVIVGSTLFFFSLYEEISYGRYVLAVAHTLVYLCFVILISAPRIHFQVRAGVVVGVLFIISLIELIYFGASSRGLAFLIVDFTFAAAVFGRTVGYWTVGVATICMVVIATARVQGWLDHLQLFRREDENFEEWGTALLELLLFGMGLVYIISTIIDRMMDGLRKAARSEAQFRMIAEQSLVGIIQFQGSELVFANSEAYRLLRRPSEDLMRIPQSEFVDDVFIGPGKSWLKTAVHSSTSPSEPNSMGEVQLRSADGQTTWCMAYAHFDVEDDLLVLVLADINEAKLDREALAESEERYRLLAENVTDVVWVANPAFEMIYASPSAVRLLWRPVSEIIGVNVMDLVSEDDRDYVFNHLERDIAATFGGSGETATERRLEFQLLRRNDELRWVESVWDYVADDAGCLDRIVGVTRDIHERKIDQIRRETLQKKLEEMQKLESLGLLAGGIAHDFNNLLLGIMGNADLALMEADDPATVRESLEQLQGSAQRAAELCNQLLAYSGKGRFVVRAMDLRELVEEMGELLRVSVNKKIKLEYTFQERPLIIEGDVTQIRQILMNLVFNARDAIDDNEGTIRIEVGVEHYSREELESAFLADNASEGNFVFVEVSDTGCGMDTQAISGMFQPFFTTKEKGHGLGLSAVLGIVRGHRGGIRVHTELEEGTSIRIAFPSSEKAAIHLNGTKNSTVSEAPISGTILVADDEKIVRTMIRTVLEKNGFEVLMADDGKEAVDIFTERDGDCDAVILDLSMPRMNGREALEELKKIDPHVQVILASGFNEYDAVTGADDPAISKFIQKPYRLDDLINAVRTAVRNRVS
jgi:PAS domain S-box-containing protein